MAAVYVVTAGSGDSYRIERVYLDAEQAYGFAQNYNGIAGNRCKWRNGRSVPRPVSTTARTGVRSGGPASLPASTAGRCGTPRANGSTTSPSAGVVDWRGAARGQGGPPGTGRGTQDRGGRPVQGEGGGDLLGRGYPGPLRSGRDYEEINSTRWRHPIRRLDGQRPRRPGHVRFSHPVLGTSLQAGRVRADLEVGGCLCRASAECRDHVVAAAVYFRATAVHCEDVVVVPVVYQSLTVVDCRDHVVVPVVYPSLAVVDCVDAVEAPARGSGAVVGGEGEVSDPVGGGVAVVERNGEAGPVVVAELLPNCTTVRPPAETARPPLTVCLRRACASQRRARVSTRQLVPRRRAPRWERQRTR